MSFQNILDVFQSWKNYLELLQKTTSTAGLIFIVSIFYSYQSTALILRSHCVGGCPKFFTTSFWQYFVQAFSKFSQYLKKLLTKLLTKCLPTPRFVLHISCRFGVLDDLRTRKMDPDKLAHNYVRLYLHASVSVYTGMQVYPERHHKVG